MQANTIKMEICILFEKIPPKNNHMSYVICECADLFKYDKCGKN